MSWCVCVCVLCLGVSRLTQKNTDGFFLNFETDTDQSCKVITFFTFFLAHRQRLRLPVLYVSSGEKHGTYKIHTRHH